MAGSYCKFCDHRCFVDRVMPADARWMPGKHVHLATCERGKEFDRKNTGYDADTAINPYATEAEKEPATGICGIVGADRIDWSTATVPAGVPYPDEPTEYMEPGVYVYGVDPGDEPENGPAVILRVNAIHGGDGIDAGVDRSTQVADALVSMLRASAEMDGATS